MIVLASDFETKHSFGSKIEFSFGVSLSFLPPKKFELNLFEISDSEMNSMEGSERIREKS